MRFKNTSLGMFVAISILTPGYVANAANISSSTGIFTESTEGVNVIGIGTNQLSWGVPSDGGLQSSYRFDGMTNFDAPEDGSSFVLGNFVHNNFPVVAGGAITSTNLAVELLGDLNRVFNFEIAHFETPNGDAICAAGGSNPCPDLVSFTSLFSPETINLNDQNFLLEIVGFQQGGTTTPSFLTLENQTNSAELIGRLTPPTAVPTPALLPGLVSLGLATLRKRRNVQASAT